jgi:hypothetical protein
LRISCPRHYLIFNHLLHWVVLRVGSVFILHVPSPVVFPGERLSALSGIRATLLRTVILPRLVVLIVDMTIQVGFGTEPFPAAGNSTLVRTFVISLMMVELVDLVEDPMAFVAAKRLRRSSRG